MPWGAVVGAVIGGIASNSAAKKGANATNKATTMSVEEQRRQFDLSRQDQKPWMDAGRGALTQMQALNSGDFSSFTQSPDYAFAYSQGLQGLDRGAAARGRMYSGGYDADRMKFASGLASQNYNQYYSRLQSMAGQGQTTASGLGAQGMGMANSLGSLWANNAKQRASSYQTQGDNYARMAGAFGNEYAYRSGQNGGGSGWYLGNNPGKG